MQYQIWNRLRYHIQPHGLVMICVGKDGQPNSTVIFNVHLNQVVSIDRRQSTFILHFHLIASLYNYRCTISYPKLLNLRHVFVGVVCTTKVTSDGKRNRIWSRFQWNTFCFCSGILNNKSLPILSFCQWAVNDNIDSISCLLKMLPFRCVYFTLSCPN